MVKDDRIQRRRGGNGKVGVALIREIVRLDDAAGGHRDVESGNFEIGDRTDLRRADRQGGFRRCAGRLPGVGRRLRLRQHWPWRNRKRHADDREPQRLAQMTHGIFSLASMSGSNGGRNVSSLGQPLAPALQPQAKLLVIDTQIAVTAADDGLRHHRFHLLRHHAHIYLIAAVVAETVEAESVSEPAEQDNVVLEPNVGCVFLRVS